MEGRTACFENHSDADENTPPATTGKISEIKSIASTSTAMRSPLKQADNLYNIDLLAFAVASDHSYSWNKTRNQNNPAHTPDPEALTIQDDKKSDETEMWKSAFSNSTGDGILSTVSSTGKGGQADQEMSRNPAVQAQTSRIRMDISSTLNDNKTMSKNTDIKDTVHIKPKTLPSDITIKKEPLDDQDMLWTESVTPRNPIKDLEISFFYNVCPLWPKLIILEELLVPLRCLGVELAKPSFNVFPTLPSPPKMQKYPRSESSLSTLPTLYVVARQTLSPSGRSSQRTNVQQHTSSVSGNSNGPTSAYFATRRGQTQIPLQSKIRVIRKLSERLKPLEDQLKRTLTEVLKNPGIAPVLNHLLKTCGQAFEHRQVIKRLSDFICGECQSPKEQCLDTLKDYINIFEVLREEFGGFANRCNRDRLDVVNVKVSIPTMEQRMRLADHMKQLQDENCKLVAVLQYGIMLLRSLVHQEQVMSMVLQMRELEKEMEKTVGKEK